MDATTAGTTSKVTVATYTALDHDPLNAYQVLGKAAYTEHATQADYVAAFNQVLAARTHATTWINPTR